jgi:DNA adenine methylase Dam
MFDEVITQEFATSDTARFNNSSDFNKQKPFLKWAGGKTQLIPALLKFIPKTFNNYIEPFIGGGALFFNLNHTTSVISDLNEELIITYECVRNNVNAVIELLDEFINEEQYFYKVRSLDTAKLTNFERAARLIYLNKTCFNGLYRVNKKGQFNVPYNKRIGDKFYDKEVLLNASSRLKNTKIVHADYKVVLQKHTKKNDFIFLDPPYQPVGEYSDFKRYTKEFFYEKDQEELADYFRRLVKKGCKVILTNSAHPFILDLYKDFQIEIFDSKRLISSNPNTRTGQDIVVLGGL